MDTKAESRDQEPHGSTAPPPRAAPSARRWPVTVPLLAVALTAFSALLPVLIPLSFLGALTRNARGAPRALAFIYWYLLCETAGVAVSLWIWLRHGRNDERFFAANFRLQCWWANALMRGAEILYELRFHIDGTEALNGPAAIMLPRHSSIADTVLPVVYYALPQGYHLRYVMKRELLWDPCLDIVGNRLPNYFIDRGGANSQAEAAAVGALLASAAPHEGLLLYPEGTRFSPAKRARLEDKAASDDALREQLERWPDLMPPRLGGSLAVLEANAANPRDLIFLAHTGFGGSSNFVELLNGSWAHSDVHLFFWRVAARDIPDAPAGRQAFLFQQWDRMQREVARLRG